MVCAQKCILEGLAEKTVILVTHQVEFLHGANLILVMRNGSIVQQGRFDELLEAGLDFESLVEAHNESLGKVTPTEKAPEVEDVEPLLLSSISASSHLERLPSSRNYRSNSSRKNPEIGRSPSTADGANANGNTAEANKSLKLIEEEERSTGSVGLAVYWLYLTTAYGGALALLILIIQIIWQGLLLAGDYWVAYETGTNAKFFDPKRFISVYGTLAVACALCVLGRALLIAVMSLLTSQDFYLRMLRSLFRAPMSFFDTTPSARILSRVCPSSYMVLHTISSLEMSMFLIVVFVCVSAGVNGSGYDRYPHSAHSWLHSCSDLYVNWNSCGGCSSYLANPHTHCSVSNCLLPIPGKEFDVYRI